MEDFPANLDDGELWIPSDIFPSEDSHHNHILHHNPSITNVATPNTSMEDLSRRFSSFNSLGFHPIPTSPVHPISQALGVSGAMTQNAVTTPPTNGCYGLTVGPNGVDHGLLNHFSGPVHHFPDLASLRYPVNEPVAEQLMETRKARSSSRPVHRQKNIHLSPFQATQFRFGFGFGFMGHCRSSSSSTSSGTGVFIPRATSIPPISSDNAAKRTGVAPQRARGASRKLVTGKAKDYHSYHPLPSSEGGLPKDWTY